MAKKPVGSHISRSESDTQAFAKRLADNTAAGDVFCLYGDLGAGKSVFARGFIRAITGNSKLYVPSPTFTLVQTYEAGNGVRISHFDLYRLEEPEEIFEIGWDDAVSDGIVLVEWPERLGEYLPETRTEIHFYAAPDKENYRSIEVVNHE